MKKLTAVLILASALVAAAWAQAITEDKVPAPVKKAFRAKYAGVAPVEWKIASDKSYEAEFTLKGVEITVKYDPAGNWLETEPGIPLSDVPKAIIDALKAKFKSAKIVETQSLELASDPRKIYEIHLDGGQEILKVLLYADGTIIKQSAKPKKGDEAGEGAEAPAVWRDKFPMGKCAPATTGTNPYFILEPGYQLVLEGREGAKAAKLVITVLAETKMIGTFEARIVEERETADGALVEVSRNYFVICPDTKDLYYFGEDVDIYKNGKITGHEGAWLAFQGKNTPGLMLPGAPRVGFRYYQEVAPGVAMDRSEILSLTETLITSAGMFTNCLEIEETTPLESGKARKIYAPGVGLIQDGELTLTKIVKAK